MFFNTSDVVIMTVSDFIDGVRKGEYQDTLGQAYLINDFGYVDEDYPVRPSKRGTDIPAHVDEIAWIAN